MEIHFLSLLNMMQVLILEELRLNLSFCLSQKTFWHILNKFDNMERVFMVIHVMTSLPQSNVCSQSERLVFQLILRCHSELPGFVPPCHLYPH